MTLQTLELNKPRPVAFPPRPVFCAELDVEVSHFTTVWGWIGAARLAHEALVQVFATSRRTDSAEFVVGNAITYLATSGLASAMPASCLGRSVSHLNAWVAADAYVLPAFDGAAVLSGADLAVTAEGTLWLHLIGDTGIPVGTDADITEVALSIDHGDGSPETRRIVAEIRFEGHGPRTAA